MAVSRWAACVCFYGAARSKRRAGGIRSLAASEWNWVFDRVGMALGTLRSWQLCGVRVHRYSARDSDAFHFFRAAMACVEFAGIHFAGDFLFYGVAGGISFPRVAAKYAGAGV